MNDYITLSYYDVLLSLGFILTAILISLLLKLGLARDLAIGALRTALQLGLAGLVLGAVFRLSSAYAVLMLVGVMILLAVREAVARQKVRMNGTGRDVLAAMVFSTLLVGLAVTSLVVKAEPWWIPSVAIPLMGMIIGNSLNGVSLTLDRFLTGCVHRRLEIETRLALGATAEEAVSPLVRESLRAGMTPIINSMMIVGVISLPGILTGQLLAGADPRDAVLYQIVVMYMIAASYSFTSVAVVLLARRRVFTMDVALRPDLQIYERKKRNR